MVRAYALFIGTPPNMPVLYTQDYVKWDNYAHLVIMALLTWMGDVLVVSRTLLHVLNASLTEHRPDLPLLLYLEAQEKAQLAQLVERNYKPSLTSITKVPI